MNASLDDGLLTPEVGPWSDKKYRLIQYYAEMFSTGMKHKWDCRVYPPSDTYILFLTN